MKFVPPDQRQAISALRMAVALVAMALLPLLLYGAPGWWSLRDVLTENATPDDFAAANQGQLKNIARAAAAEMDEKLPGGAGNEIHSLVTGWSALSAPTNDYAPVNLGQVKNVAKLFYDRLIAAGLVSGYPWDYASQPPDDFGVANIGQVKNLFSFEFAEPDPLYDGDGNGLPDSWEQHYFGRNGVDPNADFDGDGISNLQEYLNDTDPVDYYNGTLPLLAVTGGGDQRANPGTLLPLPVFITVTAPSFLGMLNAPVIVTVAEGDARLVPDDSGTSAPSTRLTLRTNAYDDEGYPAAQFYILLPPTPEVSVIRATVQSGTRSISVFTTAVAIDPTVAPPASLSVTSISPSRAKLTWTAAIGGLPTTIQASIDGGRTWITVGTAAAGISEVTVTGLNPGHVTKFRLFSTQIPPDNNNNSFALPGPLIGSPPPNPPGSNGGGAGDSADVVPLAMPVVELDQAEFTYGHRGGYLGMLGSGILYKNKKIVDSTHIVQSDTGEEYAGSTIQTFSWIAGHESFGRGDHEVTNTTITGAHGGALISPYDTVIFTDTLLRLESTDLRPKGSTASRTITLSDPYTNADAEAAGAAADLQFYGEFYEPRVNDFHASFGHGHGGYDILAAKYRFRVNADPDLVVMWDVQFTPAEGGTIQHDIHSWHSDGSTYSPVYMLDPRLENGGQNGNYRIVPLSVQLMVDGNRDGEMSFDDPVTHDADQTSEAKPYRFWVNDDDDGDAGDQDDHIPPVTLDYADGIIRSMRDLEDFSRLQVNLSGFAEAIDSGSVKAAFEWRQATGDPRIKLYRASKPGLEYLTNESVASALTISPFRETLGEVAVGTPLFPPEGFWTKTSPYANVPRTLPVAWLLFEGSGEGKGELIMSLWKDGRKIGEAPGVWLDLKNVRRMYERAKISVEAPAIPDPWDNPQPAALQWTWDPWQWPPEIDPSAPDDAIVYVHGWRMTYLEYLTWADTTFKRLYHFGYKGRFYAFHWPTFNGENNGINPADLYVPGGTTYNPSEYRAWLSGPALASFVNSLSSSSKYLVAHSMGNVVGGSALRAGMQITRYAMCNAAVAAMEYDQNIIDFNYETPDTDSDPTTRLTFGLANKLNPSGTKLINFGLPADYALGQWNANNEFFKPQPRPTANYFYRPRNSPGRKLTYEGLVTVRAVTSLAEAIGYVTQSRSAAEGTKQSVNGSINAVVNMGSGGFGFGTEHSAEWEFNMQRTYPFWREILHQFDISVPTVPSP